MKKIYFILLIIPFLGFSQEKSLWSKTNVDKINKSLLVDRNSTPVKSDIYNLDFQGLKNTLNSAISRKSNSISEVYVKFPNASGKMDRYQIYNASIMEPEFAAKYPDIQSYVGINMDEPGTTMRFSTTIFGFHAAIYTIGKTYYIDPYASDLNTYSFYAKENLYSDIERIGCQMNEELQRTGAVNREINSVTQRNANDGLLRSFRFALGSTQEYSNFHINAAGQQSATDAVKRATVLAAMNVTMTRVNGLFERDLSVTLNLIDNSSIIFLEEDDGLDNSNTNNILLTQTQTTIDNNIGTANYDVGHMFSTGGGGVASLGGICFDNFKSRALTGINSPVGDPFDVDFVAHEIGHHFGATHSYNGGEGNCGGQKSPGTAVEPGSGTTIMAYAGICAGDNVQPNSDDHFHAVSIDQIYARLTATGAYNGFPICSVNSANGNQAPTADAGQDYTIPFGTAFTLSGNGNDSDGGTVSFNWEQVDTGTTTNQPNTTSITDPQFRSYSSTSNPERTFPQLSDILNDNLTPTWEVIPNVARDMDFALTVRDNQSPNGGQTNRDDMRVTVANTGPFIITAPNTTNESFSSGASSTITWDVAGTTANGINTSNVNILLSTDAGQTFSMLAANTPNDGSQAVSFPSVNEPFCRLKIEAVGNIYFAISKSFSIGAQISVTEDCNTYTTGSISTAIPDSSGTNTQGTPIFVPVTVTETTPITDIRVSVDVTHSNLGDLIFQLQAPNGGGFSNIWNRDCNGFSNIDITFKDGEAAFTCASPTTGLANPSRPMTGFNGNNPVGNWNLVFVDFNNGNTGTVNEWSIELCTTTTSIVLSDENFELDDFALFPNPNQGNFKLQFNSNSGKSIDVDVYDISGKLVFEKQYGATSRFDEQIQLNNVSSGIYIMKINDSNKTITKKIIIE